MRRNYQIYQPEVDIRIECTQPHPSQPSSATVHGVRTSSYAMVRWDKRLKLSWDGDRVFTRVI